MEYRAKHRYADMSARKIRPFATLIRGRRADEALEALRFFPNKSARIIMTMGMPVSIYRWWYGGYALKLLTRNILNFIGIKPVRHTLYGMIATSKPATRERWLHNVEALGKAGL